MDLPEQMQDGIGAGFDDSHIVGCLLGTAVGDAIGLPYEGMSPQRARSILGVPSKHRFLFGVGMISDDTEHTLMVAQSIIASGGNSERFTHDLAQRLKLWLITLPVAGGRATYQSIFKLWLGASPNSSGVFSAGNGPAMRSAIIGAVLGSLDKVVVFAKASAQITHVDPKASYGAVAVAVAAFLSRQRSTIDPQVYLDEFIKAFKSVDAEFLNLLQSVITSVERGETTKQFANSIGCKDGVSGYVYDTVPVAIHSWLSNQEDYRRAVTSAIDCGGDADTTAAIVGGIVGAHVRKAGIPTSWLEGVREWPMSIQWMEHLAESVGRSVNLQQFVHVPRVSFISLILRNLAFCFIVLLHALRRLFPPYQTGNTS